MSNITDIRICPAENGQVVTVCCNEPDGSYKEHKYITKSGLMEYILEDIGYSEEEDKAEGFNANSFLGKSY